MWSSWSIFASKIQKSYVVRQLAERQVVNCIVLHKDFKGLLKRAGGKLPGDILMLLFSCISVCVCLCFSGVEGS